MFFQQQSCKDFVVSSESRHLLNLAEFCLLLSRIDILKSFNGSHYQNMNRMYSVKHIQDVAEFQAGVSAWGVSET